MGVAMTKSLALAVTLIFIGPVTSSVAEELLKAEPAPGTLPWKAEALVDDGTCPKGQVKKIIGGNGQGIDRKKSCVPRPK
jgi:hypothetical protein